MLTVEINPADFGADQYLSCLNTCFPGWGGPDTYDWCFERTMAGYAADRMVLRLDGNPVAGSAVSYRNIGFADGKVTRAAIMTGSWTLPESRRQGCFSRIINESLALAAQRDCGALLAFVTEDNASCSQLRKAGADLVPGYYLFVSPDTPTPADAQAVDVVETEQEIADLIGTLHASPRTGTHFSYDSETEFRSQLVDRPTPTAMVRTQGGGVAILERAVDTDRVQILSTGDSDSPAAIIRDLLAHSLSNGRKLFLYATRTATRDASLELGMQCKNGFLTIMPTLLQPDGWSENWDIASGDRV